MKLESSRCEWSTASSADPDSPRLSTIRKTYHIFISQPSTSRAKMSYFSAAVSFCPSSLVQLLPPIPAARTSSGSSFTLVNPKLSFPLFKSRNAKISTWVSSKRVSLQTHESNWEYPYDGSDGEYDDDDEENREAREREFESDFEEDEEEERKKAGVAAARNVNNSPTQYEEELMKGLDPFILVFC